MADKNMGSTLDSFLEEEGLLERATARAQKKALAYQLAEAMKAQNVSKAEMARRMKTSRSQVDSLLDPDNATFRIDSARKAARALGKELSLELI